ncbi:TLD-domain-containing protein [Westerdykella ornata]|uniref:Oxidation resistance protein 1 n=1 Tax=Westerdykella ornata TaxID=318751 RepID=A0A6A6JM11_WESOR|nr:TLD-domain-containing protein [Westerdykella ornata]KAF2277547.1 TLD-domain-containing protein [Westerdykella ornata]
MPSTAASRSSSTSSPSPSTRSSNYFTFPVSYAVSGLLRRISSEPVNKEKRPASGQTSLNQSVQSVDSMDGVYNPPQRKLSPFQPPPLSPLSLKGWGASTQASARLLTKALAEEIRLLMPPRLQLVDEWQLAYSLEQNGVSLATLYEKADEYRGKRGGFVLVVRDGSGGVFGAYLSDPPHPSPHFYGNGECFLWRASVLLQLPDALSLPLPPSADTTNAPRMTTISASQPSHTLSPPASGQGSHSGTNTPERIRFKAFPYSGINDYMIFCEQSYLSIGGGDGHYGLWLDDNLENGVSSACPTFGNEPLSDEGTKFEVLGVELWYVGA